MRSPYDKRILTSTVQSRQSQLVAGVHGATQEARRVALYPRSLDRPYLRETFSHFNTDTPSIHFTPPSKQTVSGSS
jgi:hypothetical protein